MWEIAVGTVLGGAVVAVLMWLKDWLSDVFRSRRGVRIRIVETPGPTSQEFGFTEKAVTVTVINRTGGKVEIQDIRLMFAGKWGAPVPSQAPVPRSHAALPVVLDPDSARDWHFPAEKLASLLGNLWLKPVQEQSKVTLRPRVVSATGKVYKGPTHRFSMDINSHWP